MEDSTPSPKNTESPKKSLYKEMDEIIDTLPGEHPFSVLTMGKQALKAANKVVGYINNEPMDNSELVGAVTDLGMAATGTNFARAAAAGGAKAAKGGLSIFGSFVEDPQLADQLKKRKQVADAMETKGEPKEKIWKEVGLFRDHDSKWRFEVSDKNAKIKDDLDMFSDNPNPNGVALDKPYKLEEVLDHPELFKVWPSLRDQPVVFTFDKDGDTYGSFSADTGTIEINLGGVEDGAKQRGTALHELQHAIQNEEVMRNHRSGGTGFMPDATIPAIFSTFKHLKGRFTGLKTDDEIMQAMVDEGMNVVNDWSEMKSTLKAVRSVQKAFNFMEGYFKEVTKDGSGFSPALRQADATGQHPLKIMRERLKGQGYNDEQLEDIIQDLKFKLYQDDLGEIEARTTDSRKDYSKEERRRYFPEELSRDATQGTQDFNALDEFLQSRSSSPSVKPEQLPALKNKS